MREKGGYMLSKKLKTIEELENAFRLTRINVQEVASGLSIYKIGDQLYLDEFDFYEKLISSSDSEALNIIEPILCLNKGEHDYHNYIDTRRSILKHIKSLDLLEFRILCELIIPLGIRFALNPSRVIDFTNIKSQIFENEKSREWINEVATLFNEEDFDFGDDYEFVKKHGKCTP